jgi:CheY-like chemotaxis protein
VLLNLVVNARDSMPTGGRLSIETRDEEVDSVHAEGLAIPPGPYVVLVVADSGTGIDPSILPRIFEPFFTTKADRGTGLGLSTVFGIVRQSGGAISVDSEPGRGSRFRVYLPRTEAAAGVAPGNHRATAPGTETILLVEDADPVRKVAREILVRRGYLVLDTGDPDEALRVARNHDMRIDLLLTDVLMPGMTGRQLAEKLVAERPATKVVYMSGYTAGHVLRDGVLEAGAVFVPKPLTPETLLHKIREALDGV